MARRSYTVAQHEAAHLVIGVRLGLKLREAVLGEEPFPGRPGWLRLGYVWFERGPRKTTARALTYAAGVAWDRSRGHAVPERVGDMQLLRQCVRSVHDVESTVAAATAMLSDLREAHELCTRALLERDLRGADVAALARGEWISDL